MAERGIPFSSPMVREIHADRKLHTRRLIGLPELQPSTTPGYDWTWRGQAPIRSIAQQRRYPGGCWQDVRHADLLALSPYAVGDLLWVREPLRRVDGLVTYDADGSRVLLQTDGRVEWAWKVNYLASRYCPRWASRTTLRVEEVRVERLQAISEEDARAEGVGCGDWPAEVETDREVIVGVNARSAFAALWDSINGARPGASWTSNPWVWVVRFARVEVPRG